SPDGDSATQREHVAMQQAAAPALAKQDDPRGGGTHPPQPPPLGPQPTSGGCTPTPPPRARFLAEAASPDPSHSWGVSLTPPPPPLGLTVGTITPPAFGTEPAPGGHGLVVLETAATLALQSIVTSGTFDEGQYRPVDRNALTGCPNGIGSGQIP